MLSTTPYSWKVLRTFVWNGEKMVWRPGYHREVWGAYQAACSCSLGDDHLVMTMNLVEGDQ